MIVLLLFQSRISAFLHSGKSALSYQLQLTQWAFVHFCISCLTR